MVLVFGVCNVLRITITVYEAVLVALHGEALRWPIWWVQNF